MSTTKNIFWRFKWVFSVQLALPAFINYTYVFILGSFSSSLPVWALISICLHYNLPSLNYAELFLISHLPRQYSNLLFLCLILPWPMWKSSLLQNQQWGDSPFFSLPLSSSLLHKIAAEKEGHSLPWSWLHIPLFPAAHPFGIHFNTSSSMETALFMFVIFQCAWSWGFPDERCIKIESEPSQIILTCNEKTVWIR